MIIRLATHYQVLAFACQASTVPRFCNTVDVFQDELALLNRKEPEAQRIGS